LKTIFVVDDSDTNLLMAETALEDTYRVMTMPSAAKMFSLLDKIIPDLILLDIEMPEMDGFETLQKLKSVNLWEDIPVIFLTGRADAEVEAQGFQMGAVDFMTKPFSPPVLQNRIKTHLNIDEVIREQKSQLIAMRNSIVTVLADMVENRDKAADGHIERTSVYIGILIKEMKTLMVYDEEIHEWDVDKMVSSARMHDLGQITISDLIVNKQGRLTSNEYEIMKTHTLEGEQIIDAIIARTGEGEFLRNARLFAGNHHERWDGNGYPRGLKGYEIPLHGRIMAIIDAYDMLVTDKPGNKAFTHEEAVDIIMEKSGIHYDPKIAEVFFNVNKQIKAAKAEF